MTRDEKKAFAKATRGLGYDIAAVEKLLKKGGMSDELRAKAEATLKEIREQTKPGANFRALEIKAIDMRDEINDSMEAKKPTRVAKEAAPVEERPKLAIDLRGGALNDAQIAARAAKLGPESPSGYEDPRVSVDHPETSKYITMDDVRRTFLGRDYYQKALKENPYSTRILDMSAADVKKALANNDVRRNVMAKFAADNASTLVTRDKAGNWFALERRGRGGVRNWAAESDYAALSRTMLKHPEVADAVFQIIDRKD
jgi:hypothetical protein